MHTTARAEHAKCIHAEEQQCDFNNEGNISVCVDTFKWHNTEYKGNKYTRKLRMSFGKYSILLNIRPLRIGVQR